MKDYYAAPKPGSNLPPITKMTDRDRAKIAADKLATKAYLDRMRAYNALMRKHENAKS